MFSGLADSSCSSEMWIKTDSEQLMEEEQEEEQRHERQLGGDRAGRIHDDDCAVDAAQGNVAVVVDPRGRKKEKIPVAVLASTQMLASMLSMDAWRSMPNEERERLKVKLG
jgi:hypothetical protein